MCKLLPKQTEIQVTKVRNEKRSCFSLRTPGLSSSCLQPLAPFLSTYQLWLGAINCSSGGISLWLRFRWAPLCPWALEGVLVSLLASSVLWHGHPPLDIRLPRLLTQSSPCLMTLLWDSCLCLSSLPYLAWKMKHRILLSWSDNMSFSVKMRGLATSSTQ